MAESILLRIWAEGIPRASLFGIHVTNAMSLVINTVFFLFDVLSIPAVIGIIFFAIYLVISDNIQRYISDSWIYQTIAVALIISSVVFVLGDRLFGFLGECLLHVLFAVTNMIPLRLLASGLRSEKYLAQVVAKSSFMSVYIVQTVGALPRESQDEWKRVSDLYEQSNTSDAREKLEELAAEWSKRQSKGHRVA